MLRLNLPQALPHFQFDLAIMIDQFKICTVGGDEARPARAGGERDENIEMQVAQFRRREAVISLHAS